VRRPAINPHAHLPRVLPISSRTDPIKEQQMLQREKTRERRPVVAADGLRGHNSKCHGANQEHGTAHGDARQPSVLCNASGRLTIGAGIRGFPCSIRVRTRWTREAVDALGSVSPQ
jgi:hypothetical protein